MSVERLIKHLRDIRILFKHEILNDEKKFRIENNYKNVIDIDSDEDEEEENDDNDSAQKINKFPINQNFTDAE
jgi:hypothetical protein